MSRIEVAIIGGGIMGVSLAYHLAKNGWRDVVLFEKNDLTHGSTWHAAGLCTHFAHNPTVQMFRATSVRLYRDILPKETGETCGFHPCGAMRVTRNPDRMDEFRHVAGLSKFTGFDLQILDIDGVLEKYPLAVPDGLLGGIFEPDDGHVDPTLATNGLAAVARKNGITFKRRCPVEAIERHGDRWRVITHDGTYDAQHVVNAAGTWGWEVGRMMGLSVPSVPVLHQYLVTDRIEAIAAHQAATGCELPIIRDPEESWYLRQERDGLILGPYEKEARIVFEDGVDPTFGADLMPPDLDRIEHIVEMAMARVPALAEGGIKSVINGPITFTPDANPLIGPAAGHDSLWLLTGSSMGVMEGGGAGWFLAHWMTHGAPPMDALAVDSRRFGPWADRAYHIDKAIECFGLQFGVHYPFEERPAGRNKRTSPLHDLMLERGAVMGAAHGWERPNWFSGKVGDEAKPSFQRANWFAPVEQEVRAVTEGVGLMDMSVFSKFEIAGPDARAIIDRLGANRAPARGRIGLTHVLSPEGGVISEFTVSALADDHFYLTSAAAAERIDNDVLRHAVGDRKATLDRVTDDIAVIGVMGPHSRDVLSALCDAPLDNAAHPWLSVREISVAGVRMRALRVSYVGELGWELHLPRDKAVAVFLALEEMGQAHGIRCFGAYAANSMRLEKGYRAWGMDLTTERTPGEAGLGGFVKNNARDVVGLAEARKRDRGDDRWRMVLLEVLGEGPDPFYSHPVFRGAEAVGIVTSAAHGHRTGMTLALAYLRDGARHSNANLSMEILGTRRSVRVLKQPPFDPENRLPRDS